MCGDQWDTRDAAVICHQLGYGRSAAAVKGYEAALGRDVGLPAWITGVACRGDEESLESCTSTRWGLPDGCPEQASVVCCKSMSAWSVYYEMVSACIRV